MSALSDNRFIQQYKKVAIDMLRLSFPQLTAPEIEYGVDLAIQENIQDHNVVVDNNYKKTKVNTTLLQMADYILKKQPIITAYGVMFNRHTPEYSPLYSLINSFIVGRDKAKKRMFQYPKGSEQFKQLNLVQLLMKLDANAYYGASGMFSSIYYNLYAAQTTTAQGKSCISAAALLFESFLSNNVPFGSLNELIQFIYNVKNDPYTINDYIWINHHATLEEAFFKVMTSCGFAYIPTESDMKIVWNIMAQLDQYTLNRLYYKNNLYEFCSNTKVLNLILVMLQKLKKPFVDPNSVPEEIKEDMDIFTDLLTEYVYYHHQIIDRLEKLDTLIRDNAIVMDTDSAIVSFDAWYHFVLNNTLGIPMEIKQREFDPVNEEMSDEVTVDEYDFLNDEIIEKKKYIHPVIIIPQDNLRYSIISIIANCMSRLVNDFMYRYTINSNAQLPDNADIPKGAKCMMFMKNEFLFRRLLLTNAKKHYATKQELQEGNVVPEEESLDTKGLEAFTKSTMATETKTKLKKILYEEILNTPVVDQVRVIKALAIVEKEIFNSIQSGEKKYYKPAKIRSASAYTDPMRIQGVKGAYAYNQLHQDGTEAFDLTERNSVDIVKVEITKKNIDRIKESYPDVYEKAVRLMENNKFYMTGIDAISIPLNESVPGWVLPFVRYSEIINDNIGKFPLESIGLYRGNQNNNATNIISF